LVYLIDYATNHVDNEQYLDTIRKAPPDILHVGHDLVFKSMFGPSAGSSPGVYQRLSSAECRTEMDRVTRYVDSLHRAGAKTVMPYICDVLIFGDHEKRTGFWEFYDHWEEYEEFGFGEKPATDPIAWMVAEPRRPFLKSDMYVYVPCINHPDWQRYLKTIVRLVARSGYDGVFVDINSFRCSCDACRALFPTYLSERYSRRELKRLFQFDSPDSFRLGKKGEGLLWTETLRFRGWSMARLFSILEKEGDAIRPGFLLLPNLSPMAHIDGARRRVGNGQDVGRWATTCRWLMFEEMQQVGLFGADVVSDSVLQYKFAFASGILPGLLLYHAQDRDGVSLAMAEAGAGGGGALIQGGYACPEIRTAYGSFWRENREVLEGLQSWSQVGVCYFYDQLYWGNQEHLSAVFRIRRHLSDEHVLFDFLVERDLNPTTLSSYRVVIVPAVRYVSNKQVKALRDFVRAGGVLVLTGTCGDFDEYGAARRDNPFATWRAGRKLDSETPTFAAGKGCCVLAGDLDKLVPPRQFELFDITNDEAEEFPLVMAHIEGKPAEPRTPSPLLGLLQSLGRADLAVAGDDVPPTVRISAFFKEAENEGLLAVHLLNYHVPIHAVAQSGPPEPVKGLALRLPLPKAWHVTSVDAIEPDAPACVLPFAQSGDNLDVCVSNLDIYKVVRVRCRP
jgi:hypothetical protein